MPHSTPASHLFILVINYNICIAHRFSELNSEVLGSLGGAGHTGTKWPPSGSLCPKTGNLLLPITCYF